MDIMYKYNIHTSVTSITLIAANCPVLVCRPYKNNLKCKIKK